MAKQPNAPMRAEPGIKSAPGGAERPKDRRLHPAAAARGAAPAAAKNPLGALPSSRTMALGAILACFAASGMLRFGEVLRSGEWRSLTESASSEDANGDAIATGPMLGDDKTEARLDRAGRRNEAAPTRTSAVEEADDMEEALAAMEAAIAAGEFSTASTPADKTQAHDAGEDAAYPARRTPTPPPIGSPEAAKAADLLTALNQREAELDAYAAKLAQRNEALSLAAERLETRIRELEQSKEQFEVLVATVDQAATRDVNHLIDMYEKMKPKEAGPLFDSMDPGFAAGFLARMKPDRASAILAKMGTESAYAVSLHLAGRNVRANPGARPARPKASENKPAQ